MKKMKDLILRFYANDVLRYVFFRRMHHYGQSCNLFCFAAVQSGTEHCHVISIITAILFAYVVNSRFVFHDNCRTLKDHFRPFCKFISARLATMVVEVGGVWLLVEVMGMYDMLGKFLTQFIVLVLNYIFSKFFVFTTGKKKGKAS